MHDIFTEWMKTIVCNLKGVVAIDGKQARRTGDDTKKPLHVVSAFAHEFGVVLGQIACEEKSNEITAIPKLLDMLEISGCIVTIDAMGTQKEIAEKIVSKNADYILSLKENQKTMYNEVKLFLDDIRNDEDVVKSPQYHKTVDKGHGRIEVRECVISYETGWLSKKSEWKGLNGIGAVYATIEENGKRSRQSHYFIFSCKNMTAKEIMAAKRAHWGIENSLHWVLDLSFREDESRARKGDSAENFNILRHMVYNILKSDTSFKESFPNKQFCCMLDSSYLDFIVNSWLCS